MAPTVRPKRDPKSYTDGLTNSNSNSYCDGDAGRYPKCNPNAKRESGTGA